MNYIPPPPSISENCLTLSVYTPAGINSNSSIPVLVWIHGGNCHYERDVYVQEYRVHLLVSAIAARHAHPTPRARLRYRVWFREGAWAGHTDGIPSATCMLASTTKVPSPTAISRRPVSTAPSRRRGAFAILGCRSTGLPEYWVRVSTGLGFFALG